MYLYTAHLNKKSQGAESQQSKNVFRSRLNSLRHMSRCQSSTGRGQRCMCVTIALQTYNTCWVFPKLLSCTVLSLALRNVIYLVLTIHIRYCSGMATNRACVTEIILASDATVNSNHPLSYCVTHYRVKRSDTWYTVALLHDEHMLRSALQSRKWQLIGMS